MIAPCEAIPLLGLLSVTKLKVQVNCKVFKDNNGAIKMAHVHKFRPRTKHLNVKLHHFRSYVNLNRVSIRAIKSGKQLADYLIKPLNAETLAYLRKQILG